MRRRCRPPMLVGRPSRRSSFAKSVESALISPNLPGSLRSPHAHTESASRARRSQRESGRQVSDGLPSRRSVRNIWSRPSSLGSAVSAFSDNVSVRSEEQLPISRGSSEISFPPSASSVRAPSLPISGGTSVSLLPVSDSARSEDRQDSVSGCRSRSSLESKPRSVRLGHAASCGGRT